MQTISNTIGSISHAVADAYHGLTSTKPDTESLDFVLDQEELERSRRITQSSSSRVAELNANKSADLIKNTSFPVFKGNTSAGYKKLTNNLEERERSRRLTTKSEGTLRRINAQKMSGNVKSLGWPFYHSELSKGAVYIFPDVTEDERADRLGNPLVQLHAKNNAALISNLIRMERSHNSSSFGTKRWTRTLENKERSRRISDKAELSNSARNAFNRSKIIRNLGWPFFVQENEKAVDPTISLEEQERERRLVDKSEQQLAREIAGKISHSIPSSIDSTEDRERDRRLDNYGEQQLSKENARIVAALISDKGDVDAARHNSKKVARMIDGLSLNATSLNFLQEKERKRRVKDLEGESVAKINAHKVAFLLKDVAPKPTSSSLEEEERTRRMWDRQLQTTALLNARKVSALVNNAKRTGKQSKLANRKAATRSLEDRERDRRMVDESHQDMARNHTRKLSNMVLSHNHQEKGLPFDSFSVSVPVEPLAQPILPSMPTAVLAPHGQLLFSDIAAQPLEASPVFAQARAISAPIAPMVQAPIIPSYAAPMPSSTYAAPMPSSTYAAPMPSSTYAAPMTSSYAAPSYTTVSPVTYAVPSTQMPATGLMLHGMPDSQRRKLEKQAIKHNKKAEKESKRASHQLAKADKMHTKGKETRASKLETKAEQHTVAAKHHQLWAQDLAKDASPHAVAPQIYRPAM